MRRFRSRIMGVSLALASVLAGCGEPGVQQGTVEFKQTDSSPLEVMKKEMTASLKTKSYLKKPAAPKGQETKAERKKS